jgi:hypothetical protein
MAKTKLPNKPSALIRLAVADLTAVEKQKKKFEIRMNQWFTPNSELEDDPKKKKCYVCFAGSVMANTMKLDPEEYQEPYTVDDEDAEKKLYALNDFREGHIEEGLGVMGIDLPPFLASEVEVVMYEDNKAVFKKQMLKLADVLEFHKL